LTGIFITKRLIIYIYDLAPIGFIIGFEILLNIT